MNDLEPWKIWAVTGALVLFILGSASLRVRPLGTIEVTAQASTLSPDERPPTTAIEPSQSSDQYEAYFSGYSHGSFSRGGYSGPQASMNIPAGGVMYSSVASSGMFDEYDRAPEMDVTKQMLGAEASQADLVAANDEIPTSNSALGLLPGDGYANPAWVFPATTDLIVATDGIDFLGVSDTITVDQSGVGNVRIANLVLGNATIHVTFNGAGSNGAVLIVISNGSVGQTASKFDVINVTGDGTNEAQAEDVVRAQALAEAAVEAASLEQASTEEVEPEAMLRAEPVNFRNIYGNDVVFTKQISQR